MVKPPRMAIRSRIVAAVGTSRIAPRLAESVDGMGGPPFEREKLRREARLFSRAPSAIWNQRLMLGLFRYSTSGKGKQIWSL